MATGGSSYMERRNFSFDGGQCSTSSNASSHPISTIRERSQTTSSQSGNHPPGGIHNCDIIHLAIWLIFIFLGVFALGFYSGTLYISVGGFLMVCALSVVALLLGFLALLFTYLTLKRKMSCMTQTHISQRPTIHSNVPTQPQEGLSSNIRGHGRSANLVQPRQIVSFSRVYGQQQFGSSNLEISSISTSLQPGNTERHDDTLPSYDDAINYKEVQESV